MIREKIFRLHRHTKSSFSSSSSSSSSSGIAATPSDAFAHKFLFSFSNIQVFQVPKGWDKLMLSLVSSKSGKTIRKSGKVQVKNGTCVWTEPLSESMWISDVNSTKLVDEYLCNFVISMGSSRSGILGETTLNLAAFLNAESPVMLSLPLKNCSSGTILQFEVTCLTPRTDLSERWTRMLALKEENPDEPDRADKPSEVEFCNSNRNSFVRETSFTPSVSRYSFESTDDSLGRQSSSSQSDQNGINNVMGMQDSVESSDSGSYSSYSAHGSVKSVRSVQGPFLREKPGRNQRQSYGELAQTNVLSLQQNGSSSDRFKEAGDPTVQELEAEARMWERNARKLSVDVETLRKELSDQNMTVTNLNIELTASHSDCLKLTEEIEGLKSEIREAGRSNMQKELEDELRFMKEQNENLTMQLNKTQESNFKLITLLQEMEETAAKQKLASSNSKNNHGYKDSDEASAVDQVSASKVKSLYGSESGASICEMSITNIQEGIPVQNNFSLELELLNLRNSQRTFQDKILVLESTLEDKIIASEIEQDLQNNVIKRCLVECSHTLDDKEQLIMNLEAALSKALYDGNLKESEQKDHVDDNKDIGLSVVQTQELETDCNEPSSNDDEPTLDVQRMKNETLEYVSTVAESNADSLEKEKYTKAPIYCPESIERDCTISTSDCFSRSVSDRIVYSTSSTSSHVSDNHVEDIRLLEAENINTQWEKHVTELEEENIYLSQRVSGLEAQLRYIVDAKESSHLELQHSEYQVMILQDQVRRLEEEIESRKLDTKQKLQGMEERWSEARKECESLGKLNAKLQDTTETLAEEYSLLQKLVGELKEQKSMLEERCVYLEAEARKCRDICCSCSESTEKPVINELESKFKDSELGRLQLDEENRVLRMQQQKVPELQNEVLGLRVSLKEMESQTLLLKASLSSVSEDYEELKNERVSMVQEISCLGEAVSEVEDCRRKKNALEERILRLEGDLIARDQLCAQDIEIRHELSRTKILNSQLTMKVKHLEEVRDHLQSKLLCNEDGLKQTQGGTEERHRKSTSEPSPESFPLDTTANQQSSPAEKGKNQRNLCINPSQSNENEQPGEALEANDMSKLQLESAKVVVSKEPEAKETDDTRKSEHKISMLEAELQEICQRYLQMSLKYAEVEAQREQLVMKLKALNSYSRFSRR